MESAGGGSGEEERRQDDGRVGVGCVGVWVCVGVLELVPAEDRVDVGMADVDQVAVVELLAGTHGHRSEHARRSSCGPAAAVAIAKGGRGIIRRRRRSRTRTTWRRRSSDVVREAVAGGRGAAGCTWTARGRIPACAHPERKVRLPAHARNPGWQFFWGGSTSQ